MLTETRLINYQSTNKKSGVPVTTDWRGVKMLRSHSITASVKEILQVSRLKGVVRVGIVGDMGSGKSTLAMTLAHIAHKSADVPFAVKVFNRDALLNFHETISNLEPANYIVIIDDASFLSAQASKQKMDVIKQSLTEIRHFPNQVDKRIILIINWHYEYGLDKMIRSSDFRYCTSVGISDTDNLAKMVGVKYLPKILAFQKMCNIMMRTEKFNFRLGKGNVFSYDYRKPHIPVLFYNKSTLRFVVSPTRQFVDPICNLCSNAEDKELKSDIDIKEFTDRFSRAFGFGTAKSAIRLKLFQHGINVYPKSVKQAIHYIEKYFAVKKINFEELALIYDLKDEKTSFNQKMPEANQNHEESIIKNHFPEFDKLDYASCIVELEKMAKLPPDQLDREKYEYLNAKAREIGFAK